MHLSGAERVSAVGSVRVHTQPGALGSRTAPGRGAVWCPVQRVDVSGSSVSCSPRGGVSKHPRTVGWGLVSEITGCFVQDARFLLETRPSTRERLCPGDTGFTQKSGAW